MNQLTFKINLNKFGELRQQMELEKKTFRNLILFFGLGTILLFAFILYANQMLDKKYQNRKAFYNQIKEEIKNYQVSGDYLSSKDLSRMAKTSSNRIFWAKKLVALSERANAKIAITHFSYKNGVLSLFGITKVETGQKEFDLIDEFIAGLKANQQISGDFREIKFVRSTRDREKDVDIIRFQVDCISNDYNAKGAKSQ